MTNDGGKRSGKIIGEFFLYKIEPSLRNLVWLQGKKAVKKNLHWIFYKNVDRPDMYLRKIIVQIYWDIIEWLKKVITWSRYQEGWTDLLVTKAAHVYFPILHFLLRRDLKKEEEAQSIEDSGTHPFIN